MTKPKRDTIKSILAGLSGDAIDSTSVHIDWQEARGENCDGWTSFEANKCDKCGAVVVLDCGQGGESHKDVVSGTPDECPACGCSDLAYPIVYAVGDEELTGYKCEDCGHLFADPDTCDGHVSTAEGPMMNYWYPVKIDNPRDAAVKLADLPLCVVEFQDGTTGLALTGGGMDLRWEICSAFITIGFLPPVYFTDLPAMADKKLTDANRLIVEACMQSNRILKRRCDYNMEHIKRTVESMKKRK